MKPVQVAISAVCTMGMMRLTKSGNDVDVTQLNKPSHQCLKFYSNRTQSFATHIIASS